MATATEATPCVDLTAFQRDLLATIARAEPEYGLGLIQVLESCGYSDVNRPRLYTNLDDMVGMGLVEKTKRDGRTNEYTVTTAGRGELDVYQDWLTNCLEGDNV